MENVAKTGKIIPFDSPHFVRSYAKIMCGGFNPLLPPRLSFLMTKDGVPL